jgi:hypothetical protein
MMNQENKALEEEFIINSLVNLFSAIPDNTQSLLEARKGS